MHEASTSFWRGKCLQCEPKTLAIFQEGLCKTKTHDNSSIVCLARTIMPGKLMPCECVITKQKSWRGPEIVSKSFTIVCLSAQCPRHQLVFDLKATFLWKKLPPMTPSLWLSSKKVYARLVMIIPSFVWLGQSTSSLRFRSCPVLCTCKLVPYCHVNKRS